MGAWSKLWARLKAFGADTRGSIFVKFALAVPAVSVMGLGAMDLQAVYASKAQLQEIADAAALAGARELSLAVNDDGPEGRANAYIDGHVANWADAPEIERFVEVVEMEDGSRALRVSLDGRRPSFFANLLPPGGWKMHAEATAASVAATPLCVLVHGNDRTDTLNLRNNSRLRAPACMVHSNRDIVVAGGQLSAAATQAVGAARGTILPTAATGAAPIPDPFIDLDLGDTRTVRNALDCTLDHLDPVVTSGRYRLEPGVHCNGFRFEGTAELILEPGEHWFLSGSLVLRDDARLTGQDVVLMFDRTSNFEFRDRSRVSLDGRESGPYAGLVLTAARQNTRDFVISSDHVEVLLGVIYIPGARLVVEGSAAVARESAWTVIVARYLRMVGSPSLFINADYRSSDVPVPEGVGPSGGGSQLVR